MKYCLKILTKVNEYLKGKSGLIGFFMGQIKQKSATALDAALLKKVSWKQRWKNHVLKLIPFFGI